MFFGKSICDRALRLVRFFFQVLFPQVFLFLLTQRTILCQTIFVYQTSPWDLRRFLTERYRNWISRCSDVSLSWCRYFQYLDFLAVAPTTNFVRKRVKTRFPTLFRATKNCVVICRASFFYEMSYSFRSTVFVPMEFWNIFRPKLNKTVTWVVTIYIVCGKFFRRMFIIPLLGLASSFLQQRNCSKSPRFSNQNIPELAPSKKRVSIFFTRLLHRPGPLT